jgi:hypothetical protein
MARIWNDLQANAGLREWWTWDDWPINRNDHLPFVAFEENGVGSEEVRFGGFLGWDGYYPPRGIEAPELPPGDELLRRGFLIAEHQTSGHGCGPWTGLVVGVRIRPSVVPLLTDLCRHYFFSQKHCVPKSGIQDYQAWLQHAGLTADHLDHAEWGFSEGVYPLDATPENIASFAEHPCEVCRTVEFIATLGGQSARDYLRLFVLADNSD